MARGLNFVGRLAFQCGWYSGLVVDPTKFNHQMEGTHHSSQHKRLATLLQLLRRDKLLLFRCRSWSDLLDKIVRRSFWNDNESLCSDSGFFFFFGLTPSRRDPNHRRCFLCTCWHHERNGGSRGG